MNISSEQIRELLKFYFDFDKGFFQEKLWKTKAIKDKEFYLPQSIDQVKLDFEEAKREIAKFFEISPQEIKNLASNPRTIYDCDNMARELRTKLNDIHYRRYRKEEHLFSNEYCVFQITDLQEKPIIGRQVHDYCMVFVEEDICFADLMRDYVWSIKEAKPDIINIGG